MPRRRSSKLIRHTGELALAAPAVVAHRLGRLAIAGGSPSVQDRREFTRMVFEKPVAFGEAWLAMSLRAWEAQQLLALAAMRAWSLPWGAASSSRSITRAFEAAAMRVTAAGLAPLHAAATANVRRLGRRRSARR
jgi:hypothetical protein